MTAEQIIEARALAIPYGQNYVGFDKAPCIAVQYVPDLGSEGAGSTLVGKMKITDDGFRFKVDDDTPAGKDLIANMNASGWLLYAANTTIGDMFDNINGSLALRAILKSTLRADLASNSLNAVEATVTGATGKVFFWDNTGAGLIVAGAVISGERFVNNGLKGHLKDSADEVENSLLYIAANMADSTMVMKFYTASSSAETQIGGSASWAAAGTEVETGATNPDDIYLSATRGDRMVIRVTTLTTAKGTPNRFHVLGKSAVLKNDRIVEDVQYTN